MNKVQLVKEAIKARKNSYSPYSKFKVGAALLTKSNKVYYGTNIENDALGSTICAERVAIFSAITDGVKPKDIKALAIVTDTKGVAKPCGSCRQVMSEFFNKNVEIYLANLHGKIVTTNINELLPLSFKKEDLKTK